MKRTRSLESEVEDTCASLANVVTEIVLVRQAGTGMDVRVAVLMISLVRTPDTASRPAASDV